MGIEGDLETCEDKLLLASSKLDKAATAADDSDRMRKVLESRATQDEERMAKLEEELKAARTQAEDADKKYDEVQKKLAQTESDLERAEERAEVGEIKIVELEEELRVVANNLKSLEVSEEKANQREASNKEQIKTLTAKLKQAEPEPSLLRSQSRSFRRRLTGWKTSSPLSRTSSMESLRSWSRPSPRCPDTRSTSILLLLYIWGFQRKPHESHITKVILCCKKLYICPM